MSQARQDTIWTTLMIAIESVLFVFYLGVAGLFWFIVLATGGDGGMTTTALRIFNLVLWLPLLVCFVLFIWLHVKKRKGLALLVSVLTPAIIVFIYWLVRLLNPLTGWRF